MYMEMREFHSSQNHLICSKIFSINLSLFLKSVNINLPITITTNPSFQFIIIFININTNRMTAAWQRCHFLKVIFVDFVHIYKVTGITSHKNKFVIFGQGDRPGLGMCGCSRLQKETYDFLTK